MKTFDRPILLAALALCLAGPAYADDAGAARSRIANVQDSIKSGGARWVAGETSVSGLSSEEWQDLAGLKFEPFEGPAAPEVTMRSLPASIDWRKANGNFVTSPKSQKKCGSCWAFAMTGALESYVLRMQNRPGQDLDLSEQVMLSCSGAGSCGGGILFPRFLAKTGLPVESAYPYAGTKSACGGAAPGWEQSTYKIAHWGFVWDTVKQIKSALVNYGPLPTSMRVHEDFMDYKSGVYSYTSGKSIGGHAVLLVGYDDAEQCFIVKNSWGPGWGEDGFFRIDYSELRSRVLFGLVTVAYYPADDKSSGIERKSPLLDQAETMFK